MTFFPELLGLSTNKTRVLIYTSTPSISRLIIETLNFCEKEFDFYLQNESSKNEGNDFIILETSNVEKAAQFKANIFFISTEINSHQIELALKNITPGGILIYPNQLEDTVEQCQHYFRRLPFADSLFQKNNDKLVLNTEIGSIPLISTDENLIKNLEGIKLLCQQFGVMEEEFYEAVMNFQ